MSNFRVYMQPNASRSSRRICERAAAEAVQQQAELCTASVSVLTVKVKSSFSVAHSKDTRAQFPDASLLSDSVCGFLSIC